ncbi:MULTISPECIES: ABC transporter permease [unclassified Mycoplasma]|uniref:ABC transporter permease n=1 Tax=unclassified Mycoplasma TaxID=2683645 RepID=UPI00216ADF54|nr:MULTISPECIES: ABC transporter permease [unclassified Mycoplasma]MCS4536811.1 ABC transporter permease [Mycoplasma sp. CSL7475-4]MCT4469919.1 ABC transporter permease [Mycoplasma sp. HS2188]
MTKLFALTNRNFKVFVKDGKRIFFTLMSPMIVLLCFILFARNIYLNQLPAQTPTEFKNHYADISLTIGMLSVTTFTNAISLSSVMVNDNQRKILDDFYISPIKNSIVRFSYLIYNVILNILITTIIFILCIIWMAIDKTLIYEFNSMKFHAINTQNTFVILSIIIIGSILNSSLFVFFLSYLSNNAAFSALSAGLSSVGGFLIGSFVPLHTFPRAIAEFSSIIPSTQISNLFRHFAIQGLPSEITSSKNAVLDYNIIFGLENTWWGSLLYSVSWSALLLTLSATVNISKKR